MTRGPLGRIMAMDPDIWGPPEYEPPDPEQEDDWPDLDWWANEDADDG
jgi:hypothetical protein